MTRLQELINGVRKAHPQDKFFKDFENSCRQNQHKRRHYRTYEDALRLLDAQSWQVLKNKAINQFLNHRKGQTKQGFFNLLNEAFAYRHLVQGGCTAVQMLPEAKTPVPDLAYVESGCVKHCEVKTLGISNEEIQRRESGDVYDGEVYIKLGRGFFNKFESALKTARKQISAHGPDGLVYFVVVWDDISSDYYNQYRRQLLSYCREQNIREVYIKVGLRGNRRVRM